MLKIGLLDLAILVGSFFIGITVVAPIVAFVWGR